MKAVLGLAAFWSVLTAGLLEAHQAVTGTVEAFFLGPNHFSADTTVTVQVELVRSTAPVIAIDAFTETGMPRYRAGPATGIVIAYACYRLKFPSGSAVHQVVLDVDDGVGSPHVVNRVARPANAIVPCEQNLTLNISPASTPSTPSYCPAAGPAPLPCQ
jgi:hypothetical protein